MSQGGLRLGCMEYYLGSVADYTVCKTYVAGQPRFSAVWNHMVQEGVLLARYIDACGLIRCPWCPHLLA